MATSLFWRKTKSNHHHHVAPAWPGLLVSVQSVFGEKERVTNETTIIILLCFYVFSRRRS